MDRAISNPNNDLFIKANDILEKILTIDCDFFFQNNLIQMTVNNFLRKKVNLELFRTLFLNT